MGIAVYEDGDDETYWLPSTIQLSPTGREDYFVAHMTNVT